jgi:hypothetical protein
MHRLMPRGLLPLAAVMALSACSSNSTPAATTPTPVTLTDTFDGVLTQNGAITHPFIVTASGSVTALLSTESPDATVTIGMSLGTWTGATCTVILTNDKAIQGSTVVGTASGSGSLCVRIYDVGKVTQPVTYQVQVSHP